jgi:uncharacterized protein (TIGR00106 family)
MGRVIAEVTVVPLGTAQPSLSRFVVAAELALAGFPAIQTQLTPMSTILEGDLSDVLAAVAAMHEAVFALGALRVSTRLAIDERRDRPATMEGKVTAVRALLGK